MFIIRKDYKPHLRSFLTGYRISSRTSSLLPEKFSVYLIPLFCGNIISVENRTKRIEMQVRTTRCHKSVEAGLEISAGRLVLSYDVDKTSEDMSREISTLSRFITRSVFAP